MDGDVDGKVVGNVHWMEARESKTARSTLNEHLMAAII